MTKLLTWLWRTVLHVPALIVAVLLTMVAAWLIGLSVFVVAWTVFDVNFVGAAFWGLFAGYVYFYGVSTVGPPFESFVSRLVPDEALDQQDQEARRAKRKSTNNGGRP
jgi:hypothetical protein